MTETTRTSFASRHKAPPIRPLLLIGLVLVLPVLVACQNQAPVTVAAAHSLDLVAATTPASFHVEQAELDPGAPASEPWLTYGWSKESGRSAFAWMLGDHASLRFLVNRPRPLTVVVRCRKVPVAGAPDQEVGLLINGRSAGSFAVGATDWAEHPVPVPQQLLRAGENQLTLQVSHPFAPHELDTESQDARPLSLQVAAIKLQGLGQGRRTASDWLEQAAVCLPAGGWLEYFLDLAPGAVVEVDTVEWHGGGSSNLRLAVQPIDSSEEQVLLELGRNHGPGPIRAEVPAAVQGACRLVLQHQATGADLTGGWLRLHGVRVNGGSLPLSEPGREAAADHLQLPPVPTGFLLWVVDTLRADRLGCYGYPEPLSPAIDQLAADGVVFTQALAHTSWTKPAVASILTGRLPVAHGAQAVESSIGEGTATLAEVLHRHGFQTAAWVTNSLVSERFGFDRGFERFTYLEETGGEEFHVQSDAVVDQVMGWLEQDRDRQRPFLLVVHTIDPHAPYAPREPYRSRFASQVRNPRAGRLGPMNRLLRGTARPGPDTRGDTMALYEAEIAYNDASIGRLMAALQERGLYEETCVVVVADHGEEFGEHGLWQHGWSLYNEVTRVPLVIKLPATTGRPVRVDQVVRQVDILPTIVDLAGISEPGLESDGRSLVPLMAGGDAAQAPAATAMFLDHLQWRDSDAVVLGPWKLIRNRVVSHPAPALELFHLEQDPGERTNLAAQQPARVGYLVTLLETMRATAQARATQADGPLDQQVEQRLRALGYIE